MDSVEYIRKFPIKTFKRKEVLLARGDQLTSLLAIRQGFVKVVSISDSGKESILWIAGRYDIIPLEQLFIRQAAARFFYIALTDGEYYDVDKLKLLADAQTDQSLMANIARGMSEHYDDLIHHLTAAEATSVRERIMRTLCYLANRFSADGRVDLYQQGFRLTHQELATTVGTTRETTSLELSKLRQAGLVDYSRTHFVVNVDAIKAQLD